MTVADTETKILADGLRYKSKPGGTPFAVSNCFGTARMSCFVCGAHRVRSQLVHRKLLGKSHMVCAPSCRALSPAAA